MSLAEFQSYYTSPRKYQRFGNFGLEKFIAKQRKIVKAKTRIAKSKIKANYRQQYLLTKAYADLKVGARHNEDIVIMSLFSIFVLFGAACVTASEIAFSLSMTTVNLADNSGISILSISMFALLATAILYAWFIAFLINLSSIAIMDGLARKKLRSVRMTFRKSLAKASLVASSWLLLLSLVFAPILGVLIALLISFQMIDINLYQLINISQYVVIASLCWVIYVLIHFSLVPYVLVFEPNQTLSSSFGRSRKLVHRKGRIFLLSIFGALSIFLIISHALGVTLEKILSIDAWLTFGFLSMFALLLCNAMMVVLYRKRRLARIN